MIATQELAKRHAFEEPMFVYFSHHRNKQSLVLFVKSQATTRSAQDAEQEEETMSKNKNKQQRNQPQVVKDTIAAVRKARIAAGLNNDQRFHEKRVEKDRRRIQDGIRNRDAFRDIRGG